MCRKSARRVSAVTRLVETALFVLLVAACGESPVASPPRRIPPRPSSETTLDVRVQTRTVGLSPTQYRILFDDSASVPFGPNETRYAFHFPHISKEDVVHEVALDVPAACSVLSPNPVSPDPWYTRFVPWVIDVLFDVRCTGAPLQLSNKILISGNTDVGVGGRLWVMDLYGHREFALTLDGAIWPAISPDGKTVAYVADAYVAEGERVLGIYVVNADGSDRRFLSEGVAPSWSPDGSSIVFPAPRRLVVVRVRDRAVRTLVDLSMDPTAVAWSPTGSGIVFVAREEGASYSDVYSVRPDGTGLSRLTETPDVDEGFPAWSPDGSQIVFTRFGPGLDRALYVMRPDGSEPRELWVAQGGRLATPTWSPDGTRLLVVLWVAEGGGSCWCLSVTVYSSILLFDSDGTPLRSLWRWKGVDARGLEQVDGR